MSARTRIPLFLVSAAGLAALLGYGVAGLPAFGDFEGPTGVVLNQVVLARDLLRQALLNGFYGLVLVVLFLVFQAPDVALSALAVGGGAAPLVILATLAKLRAREERRR